MGWVVMSVRELNRIEILAQIKGGRLSVAAANVLRLTLWQIHLLLHRFRADGPAGLCHKARGRFRSRTMPECHADEG